MCDGTGETETGQLPWARSRVSLSSFFVSDCARAGQRGWRGRFARAHTLWGRSCRSVCGDNYSERGGFQTERSRGQSAPGRRGKTHGRCDAEEESQSLGKEAAAAEGRRGNTQKNTKESLKRMKK